MEEAGRQVSDAGTAPGSVSRARRATEYQHIAVGIAEGVGEWRTARVGAASILMSHRSSQWSVASLRPQTPFGSA